MYINILQIDTQKAPDLAFMDYAYAERRGGVDLDNYRLVFEGMVNAADLEGVYRIFNRRFPGLYHGRSMSVSDVVAVDNGEEWEYYYCDNMGFKKFKPKDKRKEERNEGI